MTSWVAALLAAVVVGAPPLGDAVGSLGRSVRLTLELLPDDRGEALPPALGDLEGARLETAELNEGGRAYLKTTVVFPKPGNTQHEQVLFFAREAGRLRMLGFHEIRRERETRYGEATVFASPGHNPMPGTRVEVPADAYSLLGLWVALRSPLEEARSLHVWHHGEGVATPARLVPRGLDVIEALGATREAAHFELLVGGESLADYWIEAAPPHQLLEYRGPAGFAIGDEEAATERVRFRATSSSEQIRALLQPPGD